MLPEAVRSRNREAMLSGGGQEVAIVTERTPGDADHGEAETATMEYPPPPGAPPAPPGTATPPPESWHPDEWRRSGRQRIGGGLVGGLVLVVIGAYFLLRQAAPTVNVDQLWPYGAVGIGVILLVAAVVAPER
jgi:uncharacterized membrane protein